MPPSRSGSSVQRSPCTTAPIRGHHALAQPPCEGPHSEAFADRHHYPSSHSQRYSDAYDADGHSSADAEADDSSDTRRATHNAVERERRDKLNARIFELASLLPNLAGARRLSRIAIAKSSIAHIHLSRRHRFLAAQALQGLLAENASLRQEVNAWRAAQHPTTDVGTEGVVELLQEPLEMEPVDGYDDEEFDRRYGVGATGGVCGAPYACGPTTCPQAPCAGGTDTHKYQHQRREMRPPLQPRTTFAFPAPYCPYSKPYSRPWPQSPQSSPFAYPSSLGSSLPPSLASSPCASNRNYSLGPGTAAAPYTAPAPADEYATPRSPTSSIQTSASPNCLAPHAAHPYALDIKLKLDLAPEESRAGCPTPTSGHACPKQTRRRAYLFDNFLAHAAVQAHDWAAPYGGGDLNTVSCNW
ncbi:hypothetical protein GGX14DRAFT_553372 [Mycena pura]|uniref:BHLH domain-containing protein n=1 Tax=Mycena pura TaxID=153505 RepID=A0AAD6YU90_9AGAR|nr:hypothetical protein GGX14DRAFT_553372 [Mycena pura]